MSSLLKHARGSSELPDWHGGGCSRRAFGQARLSAQHMAGGAYRSDLKATGMICPLLGEDPVLGRGHVQPWGESQTLCPWDRWVLAACSPSTAADIDVPSSSSPPAGAASAAPRSQLHRQGRAGQGNDLSHGSPQPHWGLGWGLSPAWRETSSVQPPAADGHRWHRSGRGMAKVTGKSCQ